LTSRRQLTVCSNPRFNAAGLDREFREWIHYHLLIGVDHVVLYDTDGTLEELARPYVNAGNVTYFARWTSLFGEKHQRVLRGDFQLYPETETSDDDQVHATGINNRYLFDPQAESHCVWLNRGRSEWVVVLHNYDEYLSSANGLRAGVRKEVLDALSAAKAHSPISAIGLPMYFFGGPPARSSGPAVGRLIHREESPFCEPHFAAITGVSPSCIWGNPLMAPENTHAVVMTHWARGRSATVYGNGVLKPGLLHVKHYVDIFGERCPPGACVVHDDSAAWAANALQF